MPEVNIKPNIKSSLQSFKSDNLTEQALTLFKILGYNTKRQSSLSKKTFKGFKDAYLEGGSRFNENNALVSEWKYIDLLFQLSKEEITTQHGLFDTKQVDRTIIETYLFFVVELSKDNYSRTALSHITREINKVFPMPVMVLFKHGQTLTLAVINRRLHKRDDQKDVLEKVTLIKDINIANPHRAHIEILFDLSFQELLRKHKFTNFVELHNAWQKTLDTKELNKKFYKELSNWYFWAMNEVDFPDDAHKAVRNGLFEKEDKKSERNARNLIRLLTRLLFVWFVKEKGLIPEEFFDEKFISNELLKNFQPKKGTGSSANITSPYYRAVLQNLFFATLNQTMGKREFRKSGQHMNVTNLMRYERYFKDSNKFIQLVEKVVPFMNGGLFECLDRPAPEKKGKQGGDVIIYLDGFSDREDNPLNVPDYIFFGTEDHVDLSEAYGDKAKEYKDAAVKGLINILKSYKFTIAENTPLEEEVALDPELLGRVFENLLASYNPETKTTARKQTGSFYTPREIVNYMVDESLLAYLKQKLEDAGAKDKDEGLRDLISYSENPNPFNAQETKLLITAIDNCKILDPACGSGAFPMGILHKLVHVLHKLDPKNALWKQKQVEKAQTQDDVTIRDQLISNIEEAFENNELDYGRKLYLIENCIYGVDIQPIATQISKLRFLISLIVDQKVNAKKDNFGILPLPNLETKFVAANTLIGIEKPKVQITFASTEVEALEDQLKDVRHRLFSAKTPTTKRKLREEDKTLREKMVDLLVKSSWEHEAARQLAAWDPYDQSASSPFFDSEWMFGVTAGFEIVIGNPPYYLVKNQGEKISLKARFKTLHFKINLFACFIEQGLNITSKNGILCYINPNLLFANDSLKLVREVLCRETNILFLLNLGDGVFENVTMPTMIFLLRRKSDLTNKFKIYPNVINEDLSGDYFISSQDEVLNNFNCVFETTNPRHKQLLERLYRDSIELEAVIKINQGIITGDDAKYVSTQKRNNEWKQALRGRDIEAYKTNYPELYVYYSPRDLACPRTVDLFDVDEKIVMRRTGDYPVAALDDARSYNLHTLYSCRENANNSLKFILALLNSKVFRFAYQQKLGTEAGRIFAEIKILYLRKLPVKNTPNTMLYETVVDYLLISKKSLLDSAVSFENLIDAMVYELYLRDEIQSAGCEVCKHLINLPELKNDWSAEKKLAVIEKVYKELSDPKHPVSIAMAKMQEVPEIRVIEGKEAQKILHE